MGLYIAQQLQLEEVLTQAIGTPVAGTHAVKTGMAAKKTDMCVFNTKKKIYTRKQT